MTAPRHRTNATRRSWPVAIVLALAVSGCGDDGDPEVDFSDVEDAVEAGPTRIQLDLDRDGEAATVRELELQSREQLFEPERVRARLAPPGFRGLDRERCEGSLTTENLEELRFQFRSATRFEDHGSRIDCDELITVVQDLVRTGNQPLVEGTRRAPAQPQRPDDPFFTANRIDIVRDDAQGPEIRLEANVDSAHLEDCDTLEDAPGNCEGVFTVFGVPMVVDDDTQIVGQPLEEQFDIEFDGLVNEVDLRQNTATLRTGTVVRVGDQTEIRDDDDDTFASLPEVSAALDEGQLVLAEGEGTADAADPRTVEATEVRFRAVSEETEE